MSMKVVKTSSSVTIEDALSNTNGVIAILSENAQPAILRDSSVRHEYGFFPVTLWGDVLYRASTPKNAIEWALDDNANVVYFQTRKEFCDAALTGMLG